MRRYRVSLLQACTGHEKGTRPFFRYQGKILLPALRRRASVSLPAPPRRRGPLRGHLAGLHVAPALLLPGERMGPHGGPAAPRVAAATDSTSRSPARGPVQMETGEQGVAQQSGHLGTAGRTHNGANYPIRHWQAMEGDRHLTPKLTGAPFLRVRVECRDRHAVHA